MTKEKNPQKWIEKVNNYFESGFSRFGMHIKAGLYRVREQAREHIPLVTMPK